MAIIGVIIANSACERGPMRLRLHPKGFRFGQYCQIKVKLLIKYRKL